MTRSPHDYAKHHAERFREQWKDWLRIPSVSTDSAYQADVQRAAEWLAKDMKSIGLNHVQIMSTGGHPVVYGDWLNAGNDKQTILIYGHYDVQPAWVEDGWDQDPFEPIEKDGKIIARGATDDKGQSMIQLKALEAMLSEGNAPPVNIKVLIEGEEEIGSVHLPTFVQEHKELLQAELCVISDTGIRSKDQPMIVYGLRGMVTMEVIVQGPKHDLHSGRGGMIHNPAQVIAEIVAKLHDERGRVTVPGFYDDVADVPNEERDKLNQADVSEAEWATMMGDLPDWGELSYTKIERQSIRPTLEINGISGGYSGDGFKTVLPAKAKAKISCRLVPNQSSQDIFNKVRDYILEIAPPTVKVEVIAHGHGEPAITDFNHPAIQSAYTAYATHFPNPPLYARSGGSIPIVAEFQQQLGIPVILLGFGLPDANAHGPNENFDIDVFHRGIDTVITFYQSL